jgi:hypothetical protein
LGAPESVPAGEHDGSRHAFFRAWWDLGAPTGYTTMWLPSSHDVGALGLNRIRVRAYRANTASSQQRAGLRCRLQNVSKTRAESSGFKWTAVNETKRCNGL